MIRRTSAIVILCISATFALGQVPTTLQLSPKLFSYGRTALQEP